MKIKYKNGNLLSIWWIFVIGVITTGIVMGVYIYYSAEIDVDNIHSEILGERLANCLLENGNLKFDPSNFNVFEDCNLEKEVFNKGNFYFKIEIFDDSSLIFNVSEGNFAFEKNCEIQKKVKAEQFPKCSRNIEIASYNGKNVIVKIIAANNQRGEIISLIK